jgi:hypothetical protein
VLNFVFRRNQLEGDDDLNAINSRRKKLGDEWDNHVTVMRNHIDMVSVILFSPCFLKGMAGISS